MTDEQTYKLEKALQHIEDVLRLKTMPNTNIRVLATWLKTAADSCNEVAEEIKEVIL